MKSFCIPLLLWVLLKVYPLLCNYNTEDPLGWKKNRKKILEVVELCEKKYLSQTNEFVCSGNNNLRQHMDWFIEGKIFSPSLSLIPKPEKLWKQTEHRLWAESKPILRQENQKEKKEGYHLSVVMRGAKGCCLNTR